MVNYCKFPPITICCAVSTLVLSDVDFGRDNFSRRLSRLPLGVQPANGSVMLSRLIFDAVSCIIELTSVFMNNRNSNIGKLGWNRMK